MGEQKKQTFLEKLTSAYPGKFEVVKKAGVTQDDAVVFTAKNKRFGDIKISGNLHQWEDEDDYDSIKYDEDNYLECGGDFQDYCEDISLYFETKTFFYHLTPAQVFEYLEAVFNDELLLYRTCKPWRRNRDSGLYKREEFEKMLKQGRIRVPKNYRLCFWSGNYSM